MAEGIENIFFMGEKIMATLGTEASDAMRSEAILDNTTPVEVIRKALAYYVEHQKLIREGWEGPTYQREIVEEAQTFTHRAGKFLGLVSGIETVTLQYREETPEDPLA
jgi:hypothetical protein